MWHRRDGAGGLAALAALSGSTLAALSFVPAAPGPALRRRGGAPEAAAAAAGQAESVGVLGGAARLRAEGWPQLAGAVGALVLASQLVGRASRPSGAGAARAAWRVSRRASSAKADEKVAKVPGTQVATQEKEGEGALGYWDPRDEVGITEPLGYWDPAGFSKKEDEKEFRNLRAAEVKHGRVAMMAAAGAVAQHFVKFPGFEGAPAGLNAMLTPPGSYGVILLLVAAGGVELGLWTESSDKEPGNFGDPLNLGSYDEDMRNRELNNGRFAMFAAIGIIAAELITGKDAVLQLGA
uniref:Uncharacterized protein n=1 Tax=Alexandrium catenella TaxID=2925 RepID=A0A7S1PRV6_ALECA|mmetsp:Transcript_108960/g.289725  ORF Transcript_108960/g.289725 Transcript_108960/m.289725 type:complete len:295 (+) Transcript_108960:51-935(+)